MEISELVGNYLLYELSKLYEKNDLGLYRDGGLAVFRIRMRKIRKLIKSIFRENDLKITIQCVQFKNCGLFRCNF